MNLKLYLYGSILIAVAVLLITIQCQASRIKTLTTNLVIANQNILSIGDTVRTVTTRTGTEQVKYALLVKDVNDLQKLNAALAAQVKDQTGEVHNITELGTSMTHDTIKLAGQVRDSAVDVAYADSNAGGSLYLVEHIRLFQDSAAITLSRLQMNLNIECGLSVVDKKLQAFAKCDYPGVKFTSINSASFDVPVLDKPPSRFWLGCKCFGLGVGLGLAAVPVYKLFKKG